MRVLVTGGAGFIGSHLCELLVKANHEVICLDNYFTGSKKNVYPLLNRPGFEVIRHDIITPIDLEVDQIYNLACPASPVFYQTQPGANHSSQCAWCHQHARVGETNQSPNPAGINF